MQMQFIYLYTLISTFFFNSTVLFSFTGIEILHFKGIGRGLFVMKSAHSTPNMHLENNMTYKNIDGS